MLQTFATGIAMGESPRWHDGRFWMCDWMAGEILRFDGDGARETVARVEGLPFSIDWLPDGTLLTCTPDGVRAGPELAPYGAAGTPWNEIVVDPAGRAWVDMPGSMPDEPPAPGVIGVVDPDGSHRIAAGDLWFPNGMAVTDDGSTLVVAESHASRLTAFTITASGDLTDRRVWADLGTGVPDGVCPDAEGALWYADVPNGRCVRVVEGGEVRQVVEADRGCFSCVLGGDDGRTLFVVANSWDGAGASDGVVLTTRVEVPGVADPG